MSFLRKQESRLLWPATVFLWSKQALSNMDSFSVLDSRLRGNDMPGLARRERGDLLHSAKMLRKKYAIVGKGCTEHEPRRAKWALLIRKASFGEPMAGVGGSGFGGVSAQSRRGSGDTPKSG